MVAYGIIDGLYSSQKSTELIEDCCYHIILAEPYHNA